jgi:hypothetical protein
MLNQMKHKKVKPRNLQAKVQIRIAFGITEK